MPRLLSTRRRPALALFPLLLAFGGCGLFLGEFTDAAQTTTTGTGTGGSAARCSQPGDCPEPKTECAQRACTGNVCGTSDVAAATPLITQTAGDCKTAVCDGMGGETSLADDADAPAATACAAFACKASVVVTTYLVKGKACHAAGGTKCDGKGACVQCFADAECGSMICSKAGACVPASCADGVKNGQETGLDCGGPACPRCADGRGCAKGTDCTSGVCSAGLCACPEKCNGECADTATDPRNCGACGHECGGGSCVASTCQPVVLASGQVPRAIAVDSTSVYWTDASGDILEVPITGGNVTTLAAGSAGAPGGMAVDATSVYWSTRHGDVFKVPIAGGTVTPLHLSGLVTILACPLPGIAVDAVNVYWPIGTTSSVMSAPIAGGTATPIATMEHLPCGIAVDAQNVYWIDYSDPGIADPDGGPPTFDGSVRMAPRSGMGMPTTLAANQSPIALALYGTDLFWANWDGTIMQIATAGGAPTTIASGQQNPQGIARDGSYTYWVNRGAGGPSDGTVMRAQFNNGAAQIAGGQNNPGSVAVDASYVYWTTADSIVKLAK